MCHLNETLSCTANEYMQHLVCVQNYDTRLVTYINRWWPFYFFLLFLRKKALLKYYNFITQFFVYCRNKFYEAVAFYYL